MPQLASSRPAVGETYYLDTSAVFPLAWERADHAGEAARQGELRRARILIPFLQAAVAARAVVQTSILAIEELAAKTRNIQVKQALDNAGHPDWASWDQIDAAAAQTARTQIQATTLRMMQHAADGLGAIGAQLVRAPVGAAETRTAAQKQRKAHRELLRRYDRLDPMDALHIVVGTETGADRFVSFDQGWAMVTEIIVYG